MMTLPIHSAMPALRRVLADGGHAVLTSPPGAGKTTVVPLALLNEPWLQGQRIIMLEPRRLAARAAAHRMASSLGEAVGETVGYRIRFETKVGAKTRIEVVTEGILTRLLQHDPSLGPYGLVIFDEFHERSLHADLALALTLDVQRALRKDLRILVMSATLDGVAVAQLLGDAPVVSCQGRLFPVDTQYLDRPLSMPLDLTVAQMIQKVLTLESGSLLVFLPGMAEIRRVERRLLESGLRSDVLLAPLHGDLPQQAQDVAIAPPMAGKRKVVLSTAIAETSLTIEGVRVVIDSGLMRVPRFDPRTGLTRLDTIKITQDSAEQRRGRAGRLEPGVCYRLWTAAEHTTLLPRRSPEILDADLAPLVLELAAWGTGDLYDLAWLDQPPTGAVAQAKELLIQLGALDEAGKITEHGRRMADVPLHSRLAHMMLKAISLGLGHLACEVAALLGERDILRGPPGWRNADLRVRLDALHESQARGKGRGVMGENSWQSEGVTVDRAVVQRVVRVTQQIQPYVDRDSSHGSRQNLHDRHSLDELGILLAFAYPDRIAQRQPGAAGRYLLANGRGASSSQHEPISSEGYLVIADLEDGTEWARVFLAAPISLPDLEKHSADQLHEVEFVAWDDEAKVVRARKLRQLGAIVLKDQPWLNPDTGHMSAALMQGIRRAGIAALPWTNDLLQWRARVEFLRRVDGTNTTWPDMSDRGLLNRLEDWLLPYVTTLTRLDQIQRIDLTAPLRAFLTWKQQKQLDELAPSHVTVPSGSRIRVNYEEAELPVLSVRLQEMFGCEETPKIANGKVPVMIHLLSPAGRPVQVTQDLRSFWRSGYVEVRKELRGRYPKHHWPEDPLNALPTRRTKHTRNDKR
ncbi:MAG TPA: ATP-dependent helicase HrpB [Nitrospiraceae bacterium]|nr:ATP-dependent helicase HrpB [Nitrospiraceae bacterium]